MTLIKQIKTDKIRNTNPKYSGRISRILRIRRLVLICLISVPFSFFLNNISVHFLVFIRKVKYQ